MNPWSPISFSIKKCVTLHQRASRTKYCFFDQLGRLPVGAAGQLVDRYLPEKGVGRLPEGVLGLGVHPGPVKLWQAFGQGRKGVQPFQPVFAPLFQHHQRRQRPLPVFTVGAAAVNGGPEGVPAVFHPPEETGVPVDDQGALEVPPQLRLGGLADAGGAGKDQGFVFVEDKGAVEVEDAFG